MAIKFVRAWHGGWGRRSRGVMEEEGSGRG